ncbi:unnamed protein product [Staurois parvus]|uniref:Uncharacterized protein n=1 Tax=Staurois parvus TaxID=386267 RepID=A0ABN9CH20_9NEOB|nr:unnamed protein product [Staurois parvus]
MLPGSTWHRNLVPAVSGGPIAVQDLCVRSRSRVKSVNDHRDHMVQGYSQQPCTM